MTPRRTSRFKQFVKRYCLLLIAILYLWALLFWVMYEQRSVPSSKPIPNKQLVQTPLPVPKPPPAVKPAPKKEPSEKYIGVFRITAYTSGYESTQKHKGQPGYGITASSTKATQGRTISTDWTVLPPGTVLRIEGLKGLYTVEDKGGAIKGNRMDLYFAKLSDAKSWGVQHRKVWVESKGG